VSYRYQRGAICITSNKAVRDWPEMLARDEVITAAILARLLHASHVLNIRGRSYRLKELESGLHTRSLACGPKGPARETMIWVRHRWGSLSATRFGCVDTCHGRPDPRLGIRYLGKGPGEFVRWRVSAEIIC
jgi:hypothetical protein